jgi:hypothetical protein
VTSSLRHKIDVVVAARADASSVAFGSIAASHEFSSQAAAFGQKRTLEDVPQAFKVLRMLPN